MRFLVDAQLPRRLIFRFREAGHDALHALDLPRGNRTTDAELIAFATRQERIVVTKDADFVDSFMLRHQPPKLLLITTGNITNADLEALVVSQLPTIVWIFTSGLGNFLALSRTSLIVRA